MVGAVDKRYVHVGTSELAGCIKATETGTDDDYVVAVTSRAVWRCCHVEALLVIEAENTPVDTTPPSRVVAQ